MPGSINDPTIFWKEKKKRQYNKEREQPNTRKLNAAYTKRGKSNGRQLRWSLIG